ncbi:hypothetical protein QAD02_003606 [Eretmocerus hayati]|uniref:Uncharacterized protein n=1 Tax=Eretmocerus hayati TaxID=131215 RepID=A0ACC2NMJ7_9HYME|nr:hypothetical protein QAD02_003606 [Eretmocerus hayati]
MIHSPTDPLKRIVNRIYENFGIESHETDSNTRIHPIGVKYLDKGRKDYYECTSIEQGKFKNKRMTINKIIFNGGKYMLVATPFKYLRDFYTKPMKSSKLGIYFATSYDAIVTCYLEDSL